MNFEMVALWVGVVGYVLAGVTAIAALVLQKRPDRFVLAAMTLGSVCHALAIGLRWTRLGHGPYVTFFEILSSNLWSLTTIFTIACWRIPKIRPLVAIVMPILFVLMGWMILLDKSEGPLPATYHTVWLFIHVGLSKLFLGPVLIAVALALVILARHFDFATPRLARLPESARLDDLAWRFMALAFIFEILMLITGAIWAQDAWGRYWAWDPLETWAFLTWLLLAIALHLRVTYKPSPRTSSLMAVAVFALAFLTFFGVPFISTAPHKGAV